MMNRTEATALYEVFERALKVLGESEEVLFNLPESAEQKDYIGSYGRVVAAIFSELRFPLVKHYPDLDTSVPDLSQPDTLLEPAEQALVDQLTPEQVLAIDEALLAECVGTWRKVARVVGEVMTQTLAEHPEIPDGYYAQRVILLVQAGRLESRGNLNRMRYSEVRLASQVVDGV